LVTLLEEPRILTLLPSDFCLGVERALQQHGILGD
jgi:hypothetical protein